MDISSVSNLFNEYMTENATSKTSDGIAQMSNDKMKNATDDELMAACKEFETYFIEQVFKQAKSAMVPEREVTDGATKTLLDYYEDNLTNEYAKAASAQQENGLAQMLYEQMKRNYEI